MAKIVARNASFGLEDETGACKPMGGHANSVTMSWTSETPDSTGFGSANRERMPNGLQDFEFSFAGFYDSASDKTEDVFGALGPGGSTRCIFGPSGSTAGTKYSGCTVLVDYSIEPTVEGALTISATFAARSGSLTRDTW